MIEIPLSNGGTTWISLQDLPLVSQYRWRRSHYGYAISNRYENGKSRTVYLHRLLLNAPSGVWVDHVNHDRLDNTRENLRLVDAQGNAANRRKRPGASSQYKGVSLHQGRWAASIRVWGERVFLGCYADEREAALAYDQAAREHFGPYAHPNFPN